MIMKEKLDLTQTFLTFNLSRPTTSHSI